MAVGGPNDDRNPCLLLLILGVGLFFVNLGGIDLWNPDEPRYAQIAREMVQTGRWAVPHLNGAVYDQKPPLFFWILAALGAMRGDVDEWAARLPSAISATLTLLLTYLFGARLFGRRAGLLAGCVLATSLLFVVMARKANIDAMLTLQVLASIMLLEEGVRWPERRTLTWLTAFGLMGVGCILKGVGFVLPLLALVAYLALVHRTRLLLDWRAAAGLACALAVIGIPACAAAHAEGWGYVGDLIQRQILKRYVDPASHQRGPLYYFYNFPVDFWPWTAFLPSLALFLARERFERRCPRFTARVAGDHGADLVRPTRDLRRTSWCWLAAWFGTTFVFFTLSASKRELYLLPAFPAAALAVGGFLDWAFNLEEGGPALARWPFYFICWLHGFLAVVVASAALQAPWLFDRLSYLRPYAGCVPAFRWPAFALALSFGAVSLAAALLWRAGRREAALGGLVASGLVATLGAAVALLPALNPYKSARPLCDEIRRHHPASGGVAYLGSLDESYLYYLGRPIEEIAIRGKGKGEDPEAVPAESVHRLRELLRGPAPVCLLLEPKEADRVRGVIGGPLYRVLGGEPIWRKVEVWSNRRW